MTPGGTTIKYDRFYTDKKRIVQYVEVRNRVTTVSDYQMVRVKVMLDLRMEMRRLVMANNRSKWRPIENFEAYGRPIDHNLQHLEDVEDFNNTLRVVKEAVDKYSSARVIRIAKLSENTKQLMVKRKKLKTPTHRNKKKFNSELITKTIEINKSLKIMRTQIAIGIKGICKSRDRRRHFNG